MASGCLEQNQEKRRAINPNHPRTARSLKKMPSDLAVSH